jgi:phosphoenolpyruvate carboxykinase (GTP)
MRILQWIVRRAKGQARAFEGPLGWTPKYSDIDWRGLDYTKEQFAEAMHVNREEWFQEIASHNELFFKLYDRLPRDLTAIRDLLLASLCRIPEKWAKG